MGKAWQAAEDLLVLSRFKPKSSKILS